MKQYQICVIKYKGDRKQFRITMFKYVGSIVMIVRGKPIYLKMSAERYEGFTTSCPSFTERTADSNFLDLYF
jgi:hypothetical protein